MDENKVPEAGLELKAENLPAGETTQAQEAAPQAEAQEDAAVATPAPEAGESSPETTDATSGQDPEGQAEAEQKAQPAPEAADEDKNKPQPVPATKEDIIARLKEIVANGENISRTEVELLKQAYYKLHNAAVSSAHDAFIQAGGAPEDFTPPADPNEEVFKAEMGRIRELRTQAAQELEEQKQANLERKLAIIEQIKQMSATPDEADKNYDAVKQLQNEWKEIKLVPAERATELWKNYQHYVDQFYDQLHLNHEFRDYDFKKNLEIKTRLCEAAERLADVSDPVSAFHQLQKLHQEFRETGPVSKDLRETLWNRFKEASTAVNKRHQAHFEALKARENENLQQKTALCEQAEAIDTEALKTFADWDKATQHMLGLQAQWKTIGFTPKKDNTRIFERFRAACDKFFTQKTAHFKAQRETFQANQQLKNQLCEQAEALSDSTDWASTTNKLIALQKEWKTIGPVAHKASEALWKRFNTACNRFFDRKNEATAAQRQEEEANLLQKQDIIARLEKLADAPEADDARATLQSLQAEWNATGHVPFRKKEKIYKRYREVCDRLYERLHFNPRRRSTDNFRRNAATKGANDPSRELARLRAAYDAKRQEIQNYETNLTFFNSKSKTGNSIVEEINRKVDSLKADLAALDEKIKAAAEQLRNTEE